MIMYSLNEVAILPSSEPTDIISRYQVNPFDENGKLPVFVSPMTCILNSSNFKTFEESKVIPIMPRGCKVVGNHWNAVSLIQFKELINYNLNDEKILIDVANGHMQQIYDLVKEAKKKNPGLTIMVGNIAHPNMFITCCNAGVDYVRVGIGGGNGCTTSVQTGIHASLPWLLHEINEAKNANKTAVNYFWNPEHTTKIIADGGIDSISKAIKCLALGADYVMMGKMFAQCAEACGPTNTIGLSTYRTYYGMASIQGQIDISGGANKNPEGIATSVLVDTDLSTCCDKFEAALRSAMSYVGAHNLLEFREKAKVNIQTLSEFQAYDK